ncbi:VirB4 family type IV secretion/conjugal transfer ATPase [Parasulfitobacter algicola]|uniref:Type IV secretion system protein virB4 n=1 Tax=Parasulfitobacter algicola TaxID=2614809 RepID=A0ABX2IV58_9RHOB|nr:VirB4 family type IV secretion/conjugal transfer ATPase [Sulfitobacter algicola]NSX56794.1 VirB4 family type IV secretion/conjugal transfer ATPase [Sulfitobacter algicola]
MGSQTFRKRELLADNYLPFVRHADDHTVITTSRGAFQTMRLNGAAFLTADNKTINVLHERLANAMRQIADDNVMIYSHIVRRQDTELPIGDLKSSFGKWMDETYTSNLVTKRHFVNDLYVTVYVQPRGLAKLGLSQGVRKARKNDVEVDADLLEQLDETTTKLKASLQRYGPEMLGLVKNRLGVICSEPMTFLRELISGNRSLMPLVNGPLGNAVYTDRVLFGREAFEIRHAGGSTVGGILGMKDHMPKTRPTMFDELLSAPFRFVLAQSFRFLAKGAQLDEMKLRQGRMENANDAGFTQADELTDARDELMSNAWVMGEHNLSLMILADTTREKQAAMSDASRMLSDGGIVVAREDLGIESAFWAMLPGNHGKRLRPARLTSRNFAALSSFHNFPSGKPSGNFWGPAISKLKTTSGGPYFLNVHKGDLGHTFVCGPSGSGKTVFQLFVMSQLEKFGAKRVLFDKDRGGAIFVRASGGDYLDFKMGKPTGCAPFKAIPLNAATQPFFIDLIKSMLRDDQHPFTASDNARIERAVESLEQIDQAHRSVSVVREVLGTSAGDGDADIGTRFEKWCEGGRLAWVFEGERDEIGFEADLLGFDVTDFLDEPEIRNPIMLYLLYRVRQLINGQKIAIFIDEFWKALGDASFVEFAKDLLKVLRKQNGFIVMGTQDPSDVIASPISRTVINQCASKIFFPSDTAKEEEFVDEFGLSYREYTIIRSELETGQFLIRQGQDAVVCELDLKGQDDALAVLSGRTETVALMDEIIQQYSSDPDVWLPIFHHRRKELGL